MATSSSGCLEFSRDVFDSSSTIGWIGVMNYDTESHQFEVQVKRDGTLIHESSHTIPERGDPIIHGTALDCTWGDTAGKHKIRARIDGNEWIEQSVDGAIDGTVECVTVRVQYGDQTDAVDRRVSDSLDIFIRENCEDVSEYNGGCEFANE